MPATIITSVTVSHVWDDDSVTDFEISATELKEFGRYIQIKSGEDVISIPVDSLREVIQQIDFISDGIGE